MTNREITKSSRFRHQGSTLLCYACIALSKADIIGGAGIATILLFPRLVFGPFLTTVLYALTAAWLVFLIVFLVKRAKNNRP